MFREVINIYVAEHIHGQVKRNEVIVSKYIDNKEEYGKTLIFALTAYLVNRGEYSPNEENSFAPALCNRIDRNTSGIVLAAKNAEALRILNQKIKDRKMKFVLLLLKIICLKMY